MASPPASAPASGSYENRAKGVSLKYPSGWVPRKDPDYDLMLLPAGAVSSARHISFDVPDLPPHMPFMIQMNRVEHDFVQDLKKKHADLKVIESSAARVPASVSRLVRCAWHQGKQPYDDVALLIIHASNVYILEAQSDDPNLAATRAAFDSIQASLKWTK